MFSKIEIFSATAKLSSLYVGAPRVPPLRTLWGKKENQSHAPASICLFRFLGNKTNLFWLQGELQYLLSEVNWPIEIEFVIENVNNFGLEKQTCEHASFISPKIHETNTKSQIGGFDHF